MAAIMAAGEPIVWLILSGKFFAVAPLLLLFVPAELMRILTETLGMSLLARRRLKPFTALYAFQTAICVGGAALALPRLGLTGAAIAYGAATTLAAIATFATCRAHFPLKFEGRTAVALVRALLLLGVVMFAGSTMMFGWGRLLVAATATIIWLGWTLTDEGARGVLARLRERREVQ